MSAKRRSTLDKKRVAADLFLAKAIAALCQTDNCAAHQDVGSATDHSI